MLHYMLMFIMMMNSLPSANNSQVNKPYLPLASGEYSMGQATTIVSAFGFMVG